MSLAIGQSIAHYTIVEKLGQGGMGVVYKARDTHLDRVVALKVLPHDKAPDPNRQKRFVQEAKTASALRHPNIVVIHDIDTDGEVTYIAMEYVPGRSLDQAKGRRNSLKDKLKIGIQAADALAAAHAAGIVHRDVKPANVMVTEAGEVKVLDFGLAKLTDAGGPEDDEATRSLREPVTEEGVIVGTAAYMSPEQAEGKPVDARSDVFSFGALLYELFTGRRAFSGETRASTLAALLREEPKPASEVDGDIPREIDKIIQRCLRKDPSRRYQHMTDVKLALEEVREESESGMLAPPAPRRRGWRVPALAAAGVLALAVLAAAGMYAWKRTDARPAPSTINRLTFDAGWTGAPALSPDGKLVAYVSDRGGDRLDIWLQQVAGGDPIQITRDPAGASEPAFSPDSSRIAFRSERDGGGIYVVSTLGGEPRLVVKRGFNPRFSPDGAWIATGPDCAGQRDQTVSIVPSGGGEARLVGRDLNYACRPLWSEDGRNLLATARSGAPEVTEADWWLLAVDGSASRKLGAVAAAAAQGVQLGRATDWVGRYAYFTGLAGGATNLWRIPLAPDTGRIAGTPERLTVGTSVERAPVAAALPGGGTRLVFASEASNYDLFALPVDANRGRATGALQRLTDDPEVEARPTLSADGKKMVFQTVRNGSGEVSFKDLVSGRQTILTGGPWFKHHPTISPDGSVVAYSTDEPSRPSYLVPAAGGPVTKICDDCFVIEDFTPDGRGIVFGTRSREERRLFGAYVLDRATGARALLAAHSNWELWGPTISPDGRWLAFHASEGNENRGVFAAPYRPGPGAPADSWTQVASGPAHQPRWAPDGNLVYYVSGRDGFECLWTQRLDPATKKPVGPPSAVYHSHATRRFMPGANEAFARPAVAQGRIYFTLNEITSNLWMAEIPAKR